MSAAVSCVLVLVPPGESTRVVDACREANATAILCGDVAEVCRGIAEGTDALLIAAAKLDAPKLDQLAEALKQQPSWSDIPIVMLLPQDATSSAITEALDKLGNTAPLMPVAANTTLSSVLRSCMHMRQRQYRLRDEMELLRRGEERFQLVAEAGSDTLWDLDLVANRLWLGQSAHELFDRAHTHADNPADLWHRHIHAEDRERVLNSFAAAVAGDGVLWIEEYRLRRPDGSYAHVLNRAHIVRDADGMARRVAGAMMDITERKRSQELSSRLAAIVEYSEDAIISKNLDGIITSWNAGAERLFGYRADEAIGQHITLIIPPHLHEEERAILARLRQGRRIEHFEAVRRTKDGRLIDISLSVSPVRDASGKAIGASKVARDITAKKGAEQMLAKQAARLRLLLDAASTLLRFDTPDAMLKSLFSSIATPLQLDAYVYFMVDESGNALELCSSAGLPAEAVANIEHLRFGQGINGNAARYWRAVVATDVQTSQEPMVAIIKPFGIRACVCNPLIVGDRLIGTLAFASRTKDSFAKDELEFIEIVCNYVTMAYDRVSLIGKLKENDRRKDEFIATLAHELRNPLAPIRNALQILRLAGNDREAKTQAQLTMERQVAQMVRLVDDMLDVSRIASGKLDLRKESVALAVVVKNAVDTVRPLIDSGNLALTLDLPKSNVMLYADPARLAQVLVNLLNNAVKFTPAGGHIWVEATYDEGSVVVSVRDSGIGIPREALSSIFDMFSQAHLSKSGTHGGLGIGLTLVKRLVELHHGSVEAKSEGSGCGAQFIVRLPATIVQPTSLPAGPSAHTGAPATKTRCRILIADDNEDAAESLGVLLQMMGAEICIVYDGLAAVRQAAEFRPDMALLDIGMPRLSGHDAAQRIRAEPWGRDVMLVALTGWGQIEDKRRSLEAGFDHHFTKPVDPDAIERLIADLQRDVVTE